MSTCQWWMIKCKVNTLHCFWCQPVFQFQPQHPVIHQQVHCSCIKLQNTGRLIRLPDYNFWRVQGADTKFFFLINMTVQAYICYSMGWCWRCWPSLVFLIVSRLCSSSHQLHQHPLDSKSRPAHNCIPTYSGFILMVTCALFPDTLTCKHCCIHK